MGAGALVISRVAGSIGHLSEGQKFNPASTIDCPRRSVRRKCNRRCCYRLHGQGPFTRCKNIALLLHLGPRLLPRISNSGSLGCPFQERQQLAFCFLFFFYSKFFASPMVLAFRTLLILGSPAPGSGCAHSLHRLAGASLIGRTLAAVSGAMVNQVRACSGVASSR